MNKIHSILFLLLTANFCFSQNEEENNRIKSFQTFNTTRIFNAHSIETLYKRDMDIRITHRFGDISGDNGGIHTLYGLDNSTDIRIAFEYGITDNIDLGFGRSKGAGPIREIWDGFAKYKLFSQSSSMPFTLTAMSSFGITSMKSRGDSSTVTNFRKISHRLNYANQIIIGRKVSDWLSFQLMPSHTHRNLAPNSDVNDLFSLGAAGTIKISKLIGITAEYFYNFKNDRTYLGNELRNPLSVGLEIETGGHVFHLNFTNSKGIGETQFIPYTFSDWTEGEYRFGFTISRLVKL
ncbi:MAG: DUF5777 family beta-barrel protein [Flavobacteriales bacterium]